MTELKEFLESESSQNECILKVTTALEVNDYISPACN
jgi:hypothetical protein